MAKSHIAVILYGMKKARVFFTSIGEEQYGADELLSMYYGREVTYDEAVTYLTA